MIKNYNLRIVPPNSVFNEIVHFKKQFRAIFGMQMLSKSKPHITLASFVMDVKYEDDLTEVFEHLSSISKFELDIQGFGFFSKSNVLILKVLKTEDIECLHTCVEALCHADLYGKLESLKVLKTPHITISKTDGKEMLDKILEFFQKTDFYRKIEVSHLTLVSRDKYGTWDWEHHIGLS